MKNYIFTLLLLIFCAFSLFAQQKSQLQLVVSGDIEGEFNFYNTDYGRIDNPDTHIPKERTLGFFSVPPTPSQNIEFAFVIANIPGPALDTGVYDMVEVKNDFPVFDSNSKLGFITVVKTSNGTPVEEYYTVSGNITIQDANQEIIKGEFSALLKTANLDKEISIKGNFTIILEP